MIMSFELVNEIHYFLLNDTFSSIKSKIKYLTLEEYRIINYQDLMIISPSKTKVIII